MKHLAFYRSTRYSVYNPITHQIIVNFQTTTWYKKTANSLTMPFFSFTCSQISILKFSLFRLLGEKHENWKVWLPPKRGKIWVLNKQHKTGPSHHGVVFGYFVRVVTPGKGRRRGGVDRVHRVKGWAGVGTSGQGTVLRCSVLRRWAGVPIPLRGWW